MFGRVMVALGIALIIIVGQTNEMKIYHGPPERVLTGTETSQHDGSQIPIYKTFPAAARYQELIQFWPILGAIGFLFTGIFGRLAWWKIALLGLLWHAQTILLGSGTTLNITWLNPDKPWNLTPILWLEPLAVMVAAYAGVKGAKLGFSTKKARYTI